MTPSGVESFNKHQDVIKANQKEFGPRPEYFSLKDKQTAIIRFLEQGHELTWALFHRFKPSNLNFHVDALCLDQLDDGTPCPYCESEDKYVRARAQKGMVNIIWRGTGDFPQHILKAPVYKRNDKGFIEKTDQNQKIVTGFADGVWLWKCSKTVFEQLLAKDRDYKGLGSRDFAIRREGAGKDNTSYVIEPAVIDGGPQPLGQTDIILANSKYNLVELTTPDDYAVAAANLAGVQEGANLSVQEQAAAHYGSNVVVQADPASVFTGENPVHTSAFQK